MERFGQTTEPPNEMRAVAVFPKKKEVGVIRTRTPRITEPDQVRIRVLEVGVCGTDKEICSFEYGSPPRGSDYLIIGHESLGEAIEVGPKVSKLKVGDLVVASVRRPCHHRRCTPCRSGYPDFCITGDYEERGIKGENGFMSEYVVDYERYLHVVPRRLRRVAVLAEPLSVAEKAREQTRNIANRLPWLSNGSKNKHHERRLNAVVLGAGPVGLLGAMVLRSAGAETLVYALEPAPNPSSNFVESIGGEYHSQGRITAEARKRMFGHIDLIYEAAGASRLVFEALRVLGNNSEFILTGVPSLKGPYEIDGDRLMRNLVMKNQVLFGTVNASSENFDEAILDIGKFNNLWPKTLRSLITERVSVDNAPDVLQHRSKGIKTVITFDNHFVH